MRVVLFLRLLSAPAALSHLPATGNILLCWERFLDYRRGEYQAK